MKFFNLVKYEIISKKKSTFAVFAAFFIINLMRIGLGNFEDGIASVKVAALLVLSTGILPILLFVMNIRKFGEIFNSKPGYMLFLTNAPKYQIVLSKFAVEVIEIFVYLISLIVLAIVISLKIGDYDIFKSLKELFSNEEVVINLLIKPTLWYMSMLSLGKLSITIRNFIFGKVRLASLLTFAIFVGIILLMSFLAPGLYLKILTNLSSIMTQIVLVLIFNVITSLLLEKKVNIS